MGRPLGLVVRVSGKIGVGGNSKKRSYQISNLAQVARPRDYSISVARAQAGTIVGALGVSVLLVS